MQKRGNKVDIAKATIGGIIAAGGMDYIINDGTYDEVHKGRVGNAILNAIMGTGAMLKLKGGNPEAATAIVGGMIGKDLALNALPLVTQANKTLKEHNNNTFAKYAPIVATGLTAAAVIPAIPAIWNINRAADRIGDGRSVRTSTIMRRRPDEPADITMQLVSPKEVTVAKEEPENKSWLQRIFS